MKSRREARILVLRQPRDVETQSELLELLKSDGVNGTQATVYREIKEMRLIKILGAGGE